MSRKFKIGGSSKSLKDFWKEKVAAAADLKSNDGKWNDVSDLSSASDDDYKNFKFKVNTKGEMEPILSDADIGDDDIVFGASKSNLRRMADLERNVSILANKISTIDGDADVEDSSSDLFDNWITKDTAFTKDVTLGRSDTTSWYSGTTASRVDVDGHLYINNGMTIGDGAKEVIQDIAIQPMLTGNTESGITVTYDDNSIDFTVNNAPKWTTARTLSLTGDASGSVSFDGSSNASLSVTVANNSHTHDNYVQKSGDIMTGNLTVNNAAPSIHLNDNTDATIDVSLVNDGEAFYIVETEDTDGIQAPTGGRQWFKMEDDTSGVIDILLANGAGTNKVFHDGYHPNADKWTTPRKLTLAGDLTGNVTFDGSSNFTLSAQVADDSHNHVISNIDGLSDKFDTKVDKSSNQALSSQANAFYAEANMLKLVRGNGDIDSVNLATYLDDTNLARIVSGSMNSSGVATFSRDDSSSFTIDMSVLLDDTNLSRIVTAAWNTSNGVLTLTRNDNTTIDVDLDGRYDNYNGWDLYTDGTSRGRISSAENVNFVGGSNVSLAYSATDNTITINSTDTNTDTDTWRPVSSTPTNGATSTSISSDWAFDNVKTAVPAGALFTDTNTQRGIHDSPVNGATTTSISSNWAFDNVKTAVPTGAVFTDTNTWRGISDSPANDSGSSISRKWAQTAFVGASASNDTITFTKGDGTTTSVTTSDANSNTYLTGASFDTGNGVLTLSRNSGSVTVDLDGRFTDNGYADTMNQHVRTTDSPSFSNVRATSTTDVSLTSTGHAFQTGLTSGQNIAIDSNEIIARNNGASSDLHLQTDAGSVTIGNNTATKVTIGSGVVNATGNIIAGGDITANGGDMTATRFNGTATYAKYADLAERYAADAEYAEGTVMAFGGDAEVTAAAGYASGKLAGVVSHKPAVAMNAEAGDNATHPFIALQGRVPVRVEGDVKKGDILVASDVAGLAAVWADENTDPRMTAYVGIAISDSADGMVEVKVGK